MYRITSSRIILVIFILLTFSLVMPLLSIEENFYPKGYWEGFINIHGGPLNIAIDFSVTDENVPIGRIYIPIRGVKKLPLSNIKLLDNKISFKFPSIVSDVFFKGILNDNRNEIEGNITQEGKTNTFYIKRFDNPTDKAKILLEGFDGFIETAIREWNVPGLAIAIVYDGEVVFSQGFGMRDLNSMLPVTSKTLFAIASCTKAFTTFVLGTLIDEGKLDWDTPLREYIPSFRLFDPIATDLITPRDLISHQSGVPRNDLIWYNENFSREELVRRLQFLDPSADFRTKYQYTNIMYIAAGYLIERLTDQSYADAVKERIFTPLGMKSSNFSLQESRKSGNIALPYKEEIYQIEQYKYRNVDLWAPAGGLYTNVEDMSKWLLIHINKGKWEDKQIIDSLTLFEIYRPQILSESSSEHPKISFCAYALGWNVDFYRGHRRLHHGGTIDGFHSKIAIFPDDKIGIVVLSNKTRTRLPEVFVQYVADRLLELDPIDWISMELAKRNKAKEEEKEAEVKEKVRKHGTKSAHALSEYAGDYENPGYGIININVVDDHLELAYNGIITPLEHWHYEVFHAAEDTEDDLLLQEVFVFRTDFKGNVAVLESPFEPRVDNIVFTKKPSSKLFDPEYLSQFVGEYELDDKTFSVVLIDNVLKLDISEEPQATLVPDLGDEFSLKNSSWESIRFNFNEDGEVIGSILTKKGRIHKATRK